MRWFGRLVQKGLRLMAITTVLAILVVVLDAILVPDDAKRPG